MTKWIVIYLLFVTPVILSAQDVYWKTFGLKEGYPSFNPMVYTQDEYQYLWIGTTDGLIRFNGREFEMFTVQDGLPNNLINGLGYDPVSHTLFATTVGDVAYFDGQSFHKIAFEKNRPEQQFQSLEVINDGTVIVGGNNGLTLINGDNVSFVNKEDGFSSNLVKSFYQQDNETLWIGTSSGVEVLVNKKFDHQLEGTRGKNIRKIKVSPDQRIYMLEGMGKISEYVDSQLIEVVSAMFISDFFFDKEERIVVFTMQEIQVFENGQLSYVHQDIPGNEIELLGFGYVDSYDHIWTYRSDKLIQSIPRRIELISHCIPDSPAYCTDPVVFISESDDNDLWLATEVGLTKLKDGEPGQILLELDSRRAHVEGIEEDELGNVWIAYQMGGITRWDGIYQQHFYNQGRLYDMSVHSMFKSENGEILVGKTGQYIKIKNGNLEEVVFPSLQNNALSSIVEDKYGMIWLGSLHGGLYSTKGDSVYEQHLSNDVILEQQLEGDDLWILTKGNGVLHGQISANGGFREIRRLNKKTGFPYIGIMDFAYWNEILYVLTYDRLVGVDPDQPEIPVLNFTIEDDFRPPREEKNALVIDDAGILWIACQDGVQKINFGELKSDTEPAVVSIQEVQLFNQDIFEYKGLEQHRNVNELSGLKLKPKENFISFRYEGINFKSPLRVKFRTKLDGLSEQWSSWTNNSTVSYNGIPSGDYTFLVQADNGNGVLSDTEKFEFNIATPFWKNKNNQLLLALFLAVSLVTLYRYRIRIIKTKAEEQNLVNQQLARLEIEALRAKMNPHFIFNALNSIQHLVIEQNEKGALDYLKKFSTLIRQVLERSSDSRIRISEEIEMLKNYVELESLRFDHPFEFDVDIDQELMDQDIEIPYLLIQPFIENAIHHGLIHKEGFGKLILKAREKGDSIEFVIEDNGIGRLASMSKKNNTFKKESKGIQVTENRLQLLHQKMKEQWVKITDLYDQKHQPSGTRVEILVPIES